MLATLSDALPFSRALREFFPVGRTGNPVALSTGLRWHHRGIIGPSGERVFLEAKKVGGVLYVTPAAAERFVAALNADRIDSPDVDGDFQRRAREAGKALEAMNC